MTAENLITELWGRCLVHAREAGTIPGERVQGLIAHTREILDHYGCSKENADRVLFHIYTEIHWDWPEPTSRMFESLLEHELAEFFSERGIPA
jgi:hypothetical protein